MRLFGFLVKETPLVSLHEGWRGFLFLQATLLNFNYKCGRAALLLRKVLTEKHPATHAKNRRGALFFERLFAKFRLSAWGS